MTKQLSARDAAVLRDVARGVSRDSAAEYHELSRRRVDEIVNEFRHLHGVDGSIVGRCRLVGKTIDEMGIRIWDYERTRAKLRRREVAG